MRPVKLLINLGLCAAALGALAYAGLQLRSRLSIASAGTSQLTGLDQLFVGNYIELLRGADLNRPISNDPTPQTFVVKNGEAMSQVGANLQKAGLIRDGDLFRLYVRFKKLDSTIQAGTYQLRQNMTVPEIAQALQRAIAVEAQVVIPEGKRLEEVAELLKQQLPGDSFSASDFIRLVRKATYAYPFLKDLPDGASLEGYLFPNTYRVPQNPTAQDVLLKMLDTYGEQVAPLLVKPNPKGLSPRQVLTLASIVEREAVRSAERPIIANVYLNRLGQGMLLQADPTTQYALEFTGKKGAKWWQDLVVEDYKYRDPYGYNTYQYSGLPPGPIASPGLSSILAVLNPDNDKYLFFVANCNKDGGHQFSNTFAEHVKKLCQ